MAKNSTTATITTHPLPPDHQPTSWLEVALQGQGISYEFSINNKKVTLIVQNPAHLARVIVEALNKALMAFGPLLWQSMANSDSTAPITDPQNLNNHILQSFQSLPFFPDLMKEDLPAEPFFTLLPSSPIHKTSPLKKIPPPPHCRTSIEK